MFDSAKLGEIEQARAEWEETSLKKALEWGELKSQFVTHSWIPVERVYTPVELRDWDYNNKLGFPGKYPFTRSDSPTSHRGGFWTMGQYGGFGTAEETNEWFKYLLDQGVGNLSVALDVPTQIGYDSDHQMARGEVGRQGVAINSLQDMETLFDGIPLERAMISTTANAIGPIFLAWSIALIEKRELIPQNVVIGMQNEPLKEFVARGTYIFPPGPSLKFANDVGEFGVKNGFAFLPPFALSGYHIREAGATAVQELAFTMANGVAYVEELVNRGISIDDFAANLPIFFGSGMDFFEEICKFRAARRMWANIVKQRFQPKQEQSMAAFITAYTQGSFFTAQQPLNNIARGAIQGLAAVLGGTHSLTVSSMDEALALPSRKAARVALRTQQIIAHESGVTNTVDPLGGSYYVEALTDELEEKATRLFEEVQALGGALVAIEQGFYEKQIAESAYQYQKEMESGERVIVGVNQYQVDEPVSIEVRKVPPELEQRQVEKLNKLRKERDNSKVELSLREIKEAAQEGANTVSPILEAVRAYATIGEICDVLRGVWGEWTRPVI
jgi:methylmalonyl-CoA mutase N-terminal domain/subunit